MISRKEIADNYKGIDGVLSDFMSIILNMPMAKISKVLLLNNETEWYNIFHDMKQHLKKVKVYKSKESVLDEYTIVIGSDFYGMSKYPLSNHGFNQYCGGIEDGYSEDKLISNGDYLIDIYKDLIDNKELIKAIFIRMREDF
jgi:hypothetical protein